MADLVVAQSSFFSGSLLVRAGDVWAADDPVVRNYRQAFRPLVVHTTPVKVERPAPVRRSTRAPRK